MLWLCGNILQLPLITAIQTPSQCLVPVFQFIILTASSCKSVAYIERVMIYHVPVNGAELAYIPIKSSSDRVVNDRWIGRKLSAGLIEFSETGETIMRMLAFLSYVADQLGPVMGVCSMADTNRLSPGSL